VRYLGVDPGGRRLGLAVGDDGTGVVTPLETIEVSGVPAAAAVIAAAVTRHRAARVVVGLPVTADGSRTPACRRSEALAAALVERGFDVVLAPEYLSTDEAQRRAREAGLPRGRPIDHLAAAVLLEDHMGEA
jgi:putative Holliday junction resolvase